MEGAENMDWINIFVCKSGNYSDQNPALPSQLSVAFLLCRRLFRGR